MTLESFRSTHFLSAIRVAGIPEYFSAAPARQIVSASTLAEITEFIRAFDRITARAAWRGAALKQAAPTAQACHCEVCFFSAFDFHFRSEGEFKLIESNDNGSGFLFAAIINRLSYDAVPAQGLAPPATIVGFRRKVADLVESEAIAFFGKRPSELLLILHQRTQILTVAHDRAAIVAMRSLSFSKSIQASQAASRMSS